MRIKRLFLIILVVIAAGLTSSILIIRDNSMKEIDIVALNDIVKNVENQWGHISEGTYSSGGVITQPYSIIDYTGNVIYETAGGHYSNVNDAIKNRATIIDVKQNNEIVGKVIFHNNEQEIIQHMKSKLLLSISIIFGVVLLLSTVYVLYIYRAVLKPFQQLQTFAANVARGSFDMPLNMVKNNYFGAFTESFDLLREELGNARQREYESNRSKKELVATLSHDIKTPIASIKAISELMLIKASDEKLVKQVNTIYSKAEQINLLITDMFHATLEELQQLKLNVTEESSEILIEMIENVNYDGQIQYDSIPQCIILSDSLRLQQVIDNVISNSYKYAGTKIIIQSRINQDYLELRIQDFGPGISEEQLPLLFNKYYRGPNVEGKSGSGLGLYISKYFMENMGGHISCCNEVDGFTVTLKIPLAL